MNPLPKRLGEMMAEFKHIMVPELNLGQFRSLLRNKFLVDAKGLNKIKGQPFTINEIVRGVRALMAGKYDDFEVKVPTDDVAETSIAGIPGGG
jgi:2-oxoglutarate ferredoxin oxidoreductase subunit alpha